ncbi:hypothetical protein C0J52_27919 [Blattella germanica]|nr:hypothetical protein C0J52_27919 [Blattella germanica]
MSHRKQGWIIKNGERKTILSVYNYIKNKNHRKSVSFIANDNEPLIIQLMSDCSSCPSPSSSSSELDSMPI